MLNASPPTRIEKELGLIVAGHGTGRDQLLPILHSVQAKYCCINPDAQQVIANLLDIHPVEVNSVVSFYSFLHEEVGGKFRIKLCCTISCDLAGKSQVSGWIANVLGITFGETTADGMFSLEHAACMGMCDQGPALLLNDEVHTKVTISSLKSIIEKCRNGSTPKLGQEVIQHECK